jgi:hypothetical protein
MCGLQSLERGGEEREGGREGWKERGRERGRDEERERGRESGKAFYVLLLFRYNVAFSVPVTQPGANVISILQ